MSLMLNTEMIHSPSFSSNTEVFTILRTSTRNSKGRYLCSRSKIYDWTIYYYCYYYYY